MRYMASMIAVLFVVSLAPSALMSSAAFGQSADPFGAPDPSGDDPFSPRPKTRESQSKARKALIEKARKSIASGQKPTQVNKPDAQTAAQRIKAILNDETSFSFIETPLGDAMQVLAEMHDIPIVVDRRALEEIGLSADAPVTLDLRKVSLRSSLRLMLRQMDLTYLVKDEVLQITTMEAAEQNLIIEMYTLPDNLAAKSDSVIKVLTATVVPDTWETLGGPSTAIALDHVLVISTTGDIQAQTEEFLGRLIDKYGK